MASIDQGRVVEHPDTYLLLVRWDTVEDHFRSRVANKAR